MLKFTNFSISKFIPPYFDLFSKPLKIWALKKSILDIEMDFMNFHFHFKS